MKTYEELRSIAVGYMITARGLDDIGIYPKSSEGGSNPYKERSDYQNGWNDAVLAAAHNDVKISEFLGALTPEQRLSVEDVLIELDQDIWVWEREGKIGLYLNMNDTFAYACADCEEVSVDEIPIVLDIYNKFSFDGVNAWAARKRGYNVISPRICDKYKEALVYLEGTHKGIIKDKSTEENRKFWEFVEKTAKKAENETFQRGAVSPPER